MKKSTVVLLLVLVLLFSTVITASAAWYETVNIHTTYFSGATPIFEYWVKTKYGLTGNEWIKCDDAWQVKNQLETGWWLENGSSIYDYAFQCEPDNRGEDVWTQSLTWSSGGYTLTYNDEPMVESACYMAAFKGQVTGLNWAGQCDDYPASADIRSETEVIR